MTLAFSPGAFSPASFSAQAFALQAAQSIAVGVGLALALRRARRVQLTVRRPLFLRPTLGAPALSVRPSDAQIAAMIAEQNRAAQWADDEEAIAALLLAA